MSKYNTIKERLRVRDKDKYDAFMECERYLKSIGIDPYTTNISPSYYGYPLADGNYLKNCALQKHKSILNEETLQRKNDLREDSRFGIHNIKAKANTWAKRSGNHYYSYKINVSWHYSGGMLSSHWIGNELHVNLPPSYLKRAHKKYGSATKTLFSQWSDQKTKTKLVGVADVERKHDDDIGEYYVLYAAIVTMTPQSFGKGVQFVYISYKVRGSHAVFGVSKSFDKAETEMKRAITKGMFKEMFSEKKK